MLAEPCVVPTPLLNHVAGVVLIAAAAQVSRVATGGVVAHVHDYLHTRIAAVKSEDSAVGEDVDYADRNNPIPTFRLGSEPFVAPGFCGCGVDAPENSVTPSLIGIRHELAQCSAVGAASGCGAVGAAGAHVARMALTFAGDAFG
jgi:hypothetical protein